MNKRWKGAIAGAAGLGLVAGGLAVHAATVGTASPDEHRFERFSVVGAYGESDVVVAQDRLGMLGVLDLATGELLSTGVVGTDDIFLGRGAVPVVVQQRDRSVTGFDADWNQQWRFEAPAEGRVIEPVAAFPDGTVVVAWCQSSQSGTTCEHEAIDPEGSSRWSVPYAEGPDRAAGYLSGTPTEYRYPAPMPAALVTSPDGGGEREWRLIDPDDGTGTVLGIGSAAVAGPDFVALRSGTETGTCALQFFTVDGADGVQVDHECDERGYVWVTSQYLVVEYMGADPPMMVHVETGSMLSASDEATRVFASDAGLLEEVDGAWYLAGVSGDEPFQRALPAGHEPISYGSDALVTRAAVSSLNPFVPGDVYELLVIDPATGNQCAATHFRAPTVRASALPGCGVLFSVEGSTETVLLR